MRFFTLVLLSFSLSYVYGAETPAKPLPPDIQKIVTEYNDSVLTAKSKAVDDLRKVMETYTKKGDLDNAILIRNTIEAMTPKNPEKTDLFGNKVGGDSDINASVIGKWHSKTNGNIYEFMENGSSKCPGNTGKWEIKSNKLTVTWSLGGYIDEFDLPVKDNTLTGKANKSIDLTFIKIDGANSDIAKTIIGNWKCNGSAIYTINQDNTISCQNPKNTGIWEIKDNKLILKWKIGGGIDTMKLPVKDNELDGTGPNGIIIKYVKIL